MATVEEVIVQLEARMEGYNREIDRAADNTDRRMRDIERATDRSTSRISSGFASVKTAAAGYLGAISVGAVLDLAKAGLDHAASLGEVAQQLSVTTKTLQEFRYAAEQGGASTEEADAALGKLSLTLGKAQEGDKAAIASFAKLGVSVRDAGGAAITTDVALAGVADGLLKLNGANAQVAAGTEVMGKGFRKLIPAVAEGSVGLAKAAAEAREFGLVLSDKQIQGADVTADKIDRLTTSLKVKVAGVVGDNAESIGQLVDSLANLADRAVKAGNEFARFTGRLKPIKDFFDSPAGRFISKVGDLSSPLGVLKFGYDNTVGKVPAPPPKSASAPARRAQPRAPISDFIPRSQGDPFLQAPRGPLRAGGRFGAGGLGALGGVDFAQLLAAADPGGGATSLASARVETVAAAAVAALPAIEKLATLLDAIDVNGIPNPVDFAAEQGRAFTNRTGENPQADLDAIVDDLDDKWHATSQRYRERMNEATDQVQGYLLQGFNGGFDAIADNFQRQMLEVISRVVAQMIVGLATGQGTGDIGGLITSAVGSVFGPGRASGGHVSAGRMYRVNETGIEGFQPAGSGKVIPLGQMARAASPGGTTVLQPLNFDLRGAVVTSDLLAQMQTMAAQAGRAGALAGADLAQARQEIMMRRRL